MAGCGGETQHIVVNSSAPGTGPTMLPSAAAILARLNVLAPSVFPLMTHTQGDLGELVTSSRRLSPECALESSGFFLGTYARR